MAVYALPERARDEERAVNTGRGSNRELLCQRVQGMRREQQTLVGGVNRELLCQRVQGVRESSQHW